MTLKSLEHKQGEMKRCQDGERILPIARPSSISTIKHRSNLMIEDMLSCELSIVRSYREMPVQVRATRSTNIFLS